MPTRDPERWKDPGLYSSPPSVEDIALDGAAYYYAEADRHRRRGIRMARFSKEVARVEFDWMRHLQLQALYVEDIARMLPYAIHDHADGEEDTHDHDN